MHRFVHNMHKYFHSDNNYKHLGIECTHTFIQIANINIDAQYAHILASTLTLVHTYVHADRKYKHFCTIYTIFKHTYIYIIT